MPVPPENRFRFFVYVIESPSAPDLYHQRTESDLLRQAIALDGIQCVARCAISREAFEAAVKIGLPEQMKMMPDLIPVIHISAHGHSDGIGLSNGDVLTWSELKDLLKPVNSALQGGLLVCMSTCEGLSGSRMAMFPDEPELPFYAIVGCGGSPTWADSAVAYASFYHLVAKGEYVVDAVAAMRAASGVQEFCLTTAEEARQGYLDFIKRVNAGEVQRELEVEAQKEPPSDLAKMNSLERPGA